MPANKLNARGDGRQLELEQSLDWVEHYGMELAELATLVPAAAEEKQKFKDEIQKLRMAVKALFAPRGCEACQNIHPPSKSCSEGLAWHVKKLLIAIGDVGVCQSCGRSIFWVRHANGNRAPYTEQGLNHFVDCPKAEQWRRGKDKTDRRQQILGDQGGRG